MKKRLSLLLLATMLLSILSGCSSGTSQEQPVGGTSNKPVTNESDSNDSEPKDELVFANFRDVRDPNPHLYQGEMWMQEMIFETLVSVENSGIEPCLAESWEITNEGKTYTFKIREDVKFSDGAVCDAYAIEANFDAVWDNKERHVWLESMKLITGYKALDETTFVIELSAPYYPMLIDLGVTRPFGICSPNVMKDGTTKDGLTEFIGSGPYVLVENKQGEYAVFEVNENYWGDVPKIKKVTMRIIPDNKTRVLALEKGEIDLIYGAELLDAETLQAYANKDGFVASTSEPLSTRQIILNTANEILEDQDVRYALQHAVNKVAISEGIFYGIETPADSLYAKTIPYADVDLEPYAYDLAVAESYLEGSGWVKGSNGIRAKDGKDLKLRILYDNNTVTAKSISEYIQSEFLSIGVQIELTGLERQTYFDALKAGDFDIAFNIAWGTPYDPQSSLAAMKGPVYGDWAAQVALSNKAEIDQAITDVLVTTDEKRRQELYDFIYKALHESAVYIPLTYENNKSLYVDNLKNVIYKPSQYTIPFEEMYFE